MFCFCLLVNFLKSINISYLDRLDKLNTALTKLGTNVLKCKVILVKNNYYSGFFLQPLSSY